MNYLNPSLSAMEIESLYIKKSSKEYLDRKNISFNVIEKKEEPDRYIDYKNIQEKHLRHLYREGVIGQKIQLSFKEYELRVFVEIGKKPRHQYNFRAISAFTGYGTDFWYQSHGVGYRQKQKYVKKNNHLPKILTDHSQVKKDWRNKKGFLKSRNKEQNWRRGTKSRSIAERESSHAFRLMEKKMIRQEKWEELADSNALSRLYRDPWNWD